MFFLSPSINIYCLVLAFIFGAVFASFLGGMGWRICNSKSIFKGSCSYCKAKIPSLNFYGEIILAVLFVLTVLRFDSIIECVLMLFFECILYLVSVTDIYDQIIPDTCLLTAIVIRILYFCFIEGFQWKEFLFLIGNGLAVSLPLLLLVLLMEKVWGKEAMGGGDIKLLFVTGMYIGWEENLLAIFIACIIGIVVGLRLEKSKDNEDSDGYFPFGPSIAVGVVVSMLYGNQLFILF